jgi:hypothetical protein
MPAPLYLKRRLPFLIYLIGMVPLGYFQDSIRVMLGDPLALAAAIGYLIALRLLGMTAVRIFEWREKAAIDQHNAAVAAKKEARGQSRLTNANET